MTRVLITGSTTGLGLGAARELLDTGHEDVLHARTTERAASIDDFARHASGVVIGDLSSALNTRRVADQVNAIGGIDAVIHNAAVYADARRIATPEGHAHVLAINVLAPYLLPAGIERPARAVYMSSDMHASGDTSLRDLDWTERTWNGSKPTATANSSSAHSLSRSPGDGPIASSTQ